MTRSQTIRSRYESLVQADRNSARMAEIIDFLFSRSILTIKQLAAAFDMSYMAAKRYVDKLVDVKVLHEMTGYARNRVFQATEIFKALETSE